MYRREFLFHQQLDRWPLRFLRAKNLVEVIDHDLDERTLADGLPAQLLDLVTQSPIEFLLDGTCDGFNQQVNLPIIVLNRISKS